jgi:cyclic pyranopterin phosphate synthase
MTKPPLLTHVDDEGRVSMVDVSQKPETARAAVARGVLVCSPATRDALRTGTVAKGEAFACARVAGILAAKQTGALIPLCHPIPLTDVAVRFLDDERGIGIEAEARCVGRTGVEMEALVACTIAGLTLYDMAKAIERDMKLEAVRLIEKRGGKSGHWVRGA